MDQDPLTQARFPDVPPDRGHYESYYLKACDPSAPEGVWIRYTVHKRPGGRPNGSLWCTLFDRRTGAPLAVKQTLPEPSSGNGAYIAIGESSFGPEEIRGRAEAGGHEASWELRLASSEPPLHHLPREWMYRAPVPRTKLLSPHPGARFSGRLAFDGREVTLDDWPGMVGHNWGSEHAERWIWLHGIGFEGAPTSTWLDAAIGRIKLGPWTTPWVANGTLSLDGVRHVLGGIERTRGTKVDETPEGCRFILPGKDLTIRGSVKAPRESLVGWVYADPDGGEHNTVNCSVSDMELELVEGNGAPRKLSVAAGAAYELGMRETDHGVPIQPYADG
jgi:hypothetical protein